MSIKIIIRLTCITAVTVLISGCLPGGGGNIVPALKQIPAETQVLLAKSGMTQEAPIFVRIFKEESQLEIWKEKSDGRYYHFKTYPICTWSGDLGPKVEEGDKQAPEGFYTVTPGQMNPNSQFHLSFNLGYPNAYDKVNGRTGGALMVHGDCRSAGCFAMTDALIEEIYALAREAFRGGQTKFHVHAFPFRMTEENMKRHRKSRWYSFWKTLKVGYDDFELMRKPPTVAVCSRQYLVNAEFMGHVATPDPAQSCPAYRRMPIEPFNPLENKTITAKGPASPDAASSARLASYSAPAQTATPAQSSIETQPGGESSANAAPAPALLSSQPARAARPGPSTPATGDRQESAVSSGTADKPEPAGQSPVAGEQETGAIPVSPPPEAPETRSQQAYQGPPITRGMHNVVESSKSDMIVPQYQAR